MPPEEAEPPENHGIFAARKTQKFVSKFVGERANTFHGAIR